MTNIVLKSFKEILADVRSIYANAIFLYPAIEDEFNFKETLASVHDEPNKSNIKKLIKLVNKSPFLTAFNRQEQIDFTRIADVQLISHLVKTSDHDFEQSEIIKRTCTEGHHKDVIVWMGEPSILDYIQGNIAHVTNVLGEIDERYSTFVVGKEDQPHYIIGKVIF